MGRLIKITIWAGLTLFGIVLSYMACFIWPVYGQNRSCNNGASSCAVVLERATFPTTLWLFLVSMLVVGFVSLVIFSLFELWKK